MIFLGCQHNFFIHKHLRVQLSITYFRMVLEIDNIGMKPWITLNMHGSLGPILTCLRINNKINAEYPTNSLKFDELLHPVVHVRVWTMFIIQARHRRLVRGVVQHVTFLGQAVYCLLITF